jgi:hypothetical protein
MDGMTLVLFLLLPFLFVLLALGMFVLVGRSLGFRLERPPPGEWERLPRPWWGNPLLWVAVAGVLLVLGLVVAPQFLPGAVIFLPFIWVGGWRWRPRGPRCPACGESVHPEMDACPRCGSPVPR